MEYDQYHENYPDEYYDEDADYGDYLPKLDYPYEYGSLAHLVQLRQEHYTFQQEWENLFGNCMGPVLSQSASQIRVLMLVSFAMRLLVLVLSTTFSGIASRLRSNSIHLMWAASGFLVIQQVDSSNFTETFSIILMYIAFSYAVLFYVTNAGKNVGTLISQLTVAYILCGEVLVDNPEHWHRIRGIVLLLAMKVMSLAFDLDKKVESMPSPIAYFGYCMHAGTVLFGPWISMSDYRDSVLNPKPLSGSWLYHVLKSVVQAFICLLLSTCVFTYLFVDKNQPELPALLPFAGGNWLMSYKDALSFHFSHYYVSYLAQSTCMLTGVGSYRGSSSSMWSGFVITKPLSIEFPTSMLNVVVAWNIPMSNWLKTYVFSTYSYMGRPAAVFLTYVASALLHGLSFHLAAILLSLAFFSYVEHELRLKLSRIFSCVHIQARRRPDPAVSETPVPIWARLFNFWWVLINLVHLSYLGSIFYSEDEGMERKGYAMIHTLDKWANLSFFSHTFAFACLLFNYLI